MNLIYPATGKTVQIGDIVTLRDGIKATVEHFRKPHKPASEGKVSVKVKGAAFSHEYYVGVIGAEWVDREDRNCERAGLCEDFPRKGERVVLEDGFGSFVVQL